MDADLQPIVRLDLRTADGEFKKFAVKYDTGFNGELGLSKALLDQLDKRHHGKVSTKFGDGKVDRVDAYLVDTRIDGDIKELMALDFGEGGELLGLSALPQWVGCVEMRVNGDVVIADER